MSEEKAGVYPRVGGGTDTGTNQPRAITGLSPRGRGNRDTTPHAHDDRRSIPAWAGEPARGLGSSQGRWVYPRVGGGTPTPPGT